jgi:hypothetical protein
MKTRLTSLLGSVILAFLPLVPVGVFELVRFTLGETGAWVLVVIGIMIYGFLTGLKKEYEMRDKIDFAMKHGGIDTRPPPLPEHHVPHVRVHHLPPH